MVLATFQNISLRMLFYLLSSFVSIRTELSGDSPDISFYETSVSDVIMMREKKKSNSQGSFTQLSLFPQGLIKCYTNKTLWLPLLIQGLALFPQPLLSGLFCFIIIILLVIYIYHRA